MRSVRDEVRKVIGTVPPVGDRVWARADDAAVGAASDRVWWPVRNEVKDYAQRRGGWQTGYVEELIG